MIRLVPALYVMLAVMSVAHLLAFPEHAPLFFIKEILPPALYVSNLTLIFFDTPIITFGHTWSLAVEEQFYLIWPVVLLFALRRSSKATLYTAIGIAIAAVIWRGCLLHHGVAPGHDRWLSESLDTRADELLVGAAAALLNPATQRLVSRLWPIGLTVVIYMIAAEQNWGTHQAYYGGAFAFSAATAVFLLKIKTSQDWIITRALSLKPLAALGMISYAFYLWHAPILVILIGKTTLHTYGLASICFLLATGAATLSWFFVEVPAKRFLSRIALKSQGYKERCESAHVMSPPPREADYTARS